MPNWLQTALIVLAVLVVLYLLLVAAQLVVVTILRRQYAPTRMQIETAQRDVSNARKRLDQLAPFIASGSREMPLGPLYDQARDLIAKATHSAGEALRQVNALIEERIAEEPAVAALRLVPMTREIMRRLGMRQGARTAAVQLSAFSDSMSRVNQLQADIAAMPKREKDALTQTRQRAQTLTAMLDAEVRPKQPLLDGRETLRQATTNLTQAERLLSAESPTEAAVVAAYPLRLASEEQLSALDDVLAEMKRKRTQAEAALAKLDEQLQTHKNEISTEASGGLPRPMFIARATESDAHITALQTKIDAGEYEAAAALAMDAQMHLAAQSAALAAVRAERARIIGMADKAQRHLVTIGQWIGETSAQFVLDRTTAAQADLQDAERDLRALAPLEDASAMAAASALDTRVDEGFRKASTIRGEFEAQHTKFDEMTQLVNERSVAAMVAQARQAGESLSQVNTAYWGDLTPARITAAADALTEAWDAEKASLAKIVESDLPNVLARLQPVREAFLSAGGLHADAVRIMQAVEADKAQATSALHDDGIMSVLREINAIAVSSSSLAASPKAINARIEALRADFTQTAPDYKSILTEAQHLRKQAEDFLADHRGRLKQALDDLDKMRYQLRAQHAALKQVDDDAHIAFAPLAETVAAKLDAWLKANSASTQAPLDDVNRSVAQGGALQREATETLKRAADMNRYVGDKKQAAKTALAELNGVLSSAQAGLATITEVDGSATLLDTARKPMIEALELLNRLEQPARLAPGDALTAVDRLTMLVSTARVQADEAHAEIARRVNDMKKVTE